MSKWTPKNFRDRKVNLLMFSNIALWSALRKVSEFQWSNQDVQTQRGFQSHPLDQTTASLTMNFGWFQRTKKILPLQCTLQYLQKPWKKNIKTSCINSRQKKNILQYIDLFPFNLFKKPNKFEISSFSQLSNLPTYSRSLAFQTAYETTISSPPGGQGI